MDNQNEKGQLQTLQLSFYEFYSNFFAVLLLIICENSQIKKDTKYVFHKLTVSKHNGTKIEECPFCVPFTVKPALRDHSAKRTPSDLETTYVTSAPNMVL